MKILKILSITSFQHAHSDAVNFNENSENLSNFIWKQNKNSEKEVNTHDFKKSDFNKSVNTAETSSDERLMMIHH